MNNLKLVLEVENLTDKELGHVEILDFNRTLKMHGDFMQGDHVILPTDNALEGFVKVTILEVHTLTKIIKKMKKTSSYSPVLRYLHHNSSMFINHIRISSENQEQLEVDFTLNTLNNVMDVEKTVIVIASIHFLLPISPKK